MNQENQLEELVKLTAIDEDILCVLGEQKLYGLKILRELNEGRNPIMSFGSLYPALNRLVKKRLVTWHWGDEQEVTGGGRRKYYQATSIGKSSLEKLYRYRFSKMLKASYFFQEDFCYFILDYLLLYVGGFEKLIELLAQCTQENSDLDLKNNRLISAEFWQIFSNKLREARHQIEQRLAEFADKDGLTVEVFPPRIRARCPSENND